MIDDVAKRIADTAHGRPERAAQRRHPDLRRDGRGKTEKQKKDDAVSHNPYI